MTEFRIDRYTRNRGGPAMIQINCGSCGAYLLTYQKDGGGDLVRCYFDRIHGPEHLKNLQGLFAEQLPKELVCPGCQAIIGHVYTYVSERKQERRLAFSLVENAFTIVIV